MMAKAVNSAESPLRLSWPSVFLSHTMSLLGAVMQAGLKLLSKPRADEFGSPWPERASAADQRKGQKFGLGILGRRPP